MLALTAPYGWDSPCYASVTLTVAGRWNPDEVVQILTKYSCHPPAIPKILQVLHYSSRYDCNLQYGWFKDQHKACIADLARAGITLSINYWVQGWKVVPTK